MKATMKTTSIFAVICALALSACAPQPEAILPTYMSPTTFSGQSCSQLNLRANDLNGRLAAATGQQKAAADSDAGKTALTLILFWPAVFWIGNKDQAPAIASMRGEAQALQSAAAAQNCG